MRTRLSKEILGQLVRFGLVGGIAVAVNYGVYCLILPYSSHNISYTIGYILSFIINYLLTTSFTFHSGRSYRNGLGFAICHVVNYIMQMILLNFFIFLGVNRILAPVPVLSICVPTNFLLVRWVMIYFGDKS